ncbi:MAG: AEC family transporter [Oceanicoccus sp.]
MPRLAHQCDTNTVTSALQDENPHMNVSETFLYTAEIVAPVFLIVFLGIYLTQKKLIDQHFVSVSSKLVFTVTLPTLLFINVVQTDFDTVFNAGQIGVSILATVLSFIVVWYLSPTFVTRGDRGVFTQGACRGNLGIVGLALCINMYGSEGLAAASLVLAIIIPLYNVLSVIVLNLSLHEHGQLPWKKIFSEIAKNPLIIAVCLALPFSLMKVQIPTILINTGDYLANMTLPLALLGIGGVLSLKELKTTSTPSIAAALLKTLILPALCTLGAYLWGLRGVHLGVLYLLFSSPTATVSFIMVRAMNGNAPLAANMILLSTLGSLISLSAGIYILRLYQLI